MKSQQFLRRITNLTLILLLAGCSTHAQTPAQTGQHAYTLEGRLNYLLFLPEDYGKVPGKEWPLILFLHGIGERSDDLEDLKVLKLYGPSMLAEQQADFPFIVVSPQCPLDSYWVDHLNDLDALLDRIVAVNAVDTSRIYLTGFSMGGWGTWHLTLRYPKRFAAIAPIAGFYEFESSATPENVCDLKDIPTWVFHGAQDTTVPPSRSEVMVDALRNCGGDVRFTLYPDADHDSWTETYNNPELYTWLLQQENPEAGITYTSWYLVGALLVAGLLVTAIYLYGKKTRSGQL